MLQKTLKNSSRKPHQINGRISSIWPSQKVWVKKHTCHQRKRIKFLPPCRLYISYQLDEYSNSNAPVESVEDSFKKTGRMFIMSERPGYFILLQNIHVGWAS